MLGKNIKKPVIFKIVLGIVLLVFVFVFIFRPFRVSGNTGPYKNGDWIIATKSFFYPEKPISNGRFVVVSMPYGGQKISQIAEVKGYSAPYYRVEISGYEIGIKDSDILYVVW